MQWAEDFELGVVELDSQHRNIHSLILRIREVEAPADHDCIGSAIVEIQRVASAHFEYEERLMLEYDCPDLARHAADHARLMQEIHGYVGNPVFNPQQLTRVLFNWLTSHIMLGDRPLANHILQLRERRGDPATGTKPAGTS